MHEERKFTGSYWAGVSGANQVTYPELAEDLETDVVVVGAGIVGLTAAEILTRAGKSVVVLESLRVATQATARSTAKISSQHGLVYSRLIRDFGEEAARHYGQANERAIGHVAELVRRERLECSFERQPAYVYTTSEERIRDIEGEAAAALRLGLPAHLTREIPAPVPAVIALRFDDQAQFNPVRYLAGLAAVVAADARLFEQSRVVEVGKESEAGHQWVRTAHGNRVGARDVIIATHLPTVPDGKLFAKAFPFGHSMLAAAIDAGYMPAGMFISADTPSHSFRMDRSSDVPHLLAVGASFATGTTTEEAHSFEELEQFLRRHFGIDTPAYRWTNEDFQSMDGLPFIGRASSDSGNLYVATGFNAWGITNGTFAARLLSDLVLGRDNPCADLFSPARLKPLVGGTEFLKRNLQTAKHFLGDRLLPGREDLEIGDGEALVAKLDGETVAAYRDEAGGLHLVSAVCTHMGCILGWNATDRTWDCPCHGSRFDPDGAVVHGPATSPLKRLQAPAQGS